ncbi:hypothetical protein [Dyella nitratireducens]|uniref:Secreted protein n=1 Tax=Dyella nitratireducens TaxID=1849580 RepID=A0ABQ1GUA2_9GAMM|nr:hypothetical protein [Dyella nitratireducens]GGA50506.1 hypothetical protein GCM10010981_44830 [Dyella nitratireducens]GLQ42598.1 hypothetical protein GCM10007902_24480 [Dyella nitratireducens]
MSKRTFGLTAAVLLCAGALTGLPVTSAQAGEAPVKCHLTYSLSGWSAIYQHAEGRGDIRCDNGQSAAVSINMHGGGLTAGKFHVSGHGDISNVYGIKDVYGSYAQAGASAGVVRSGTAQVLTKGTTSIALSGTGEGVNLGLAVDKFDIEPLHR